MSKAAEFALARGIAETIPGSGVTVNSLIPGPTDSELIGNLLTQFANQLGVSEENFRRDFSNNGGHGNLTRRFAATGEVAAMATYLCSELASATTGSPIRVDGGSIRSAFSTVWGIGWTPDPVEILRWVSGLPGTVSVVLRSPDEAGVARKQIGDHLGPR